MITVAVFTSASALPDMRTIDANDLQAMQAIVGGYIEVLPMPDGLHAVCNEECGRHGAPAHHAVLSRQGVPRVIDGDFIVCRTKGSDFASLREDDAARLLQVVRQYALES